MSDIRMNSSAQLDDVEIEYLVSPGDRTVEFTFDHDRTLMITMTERALARCAEQFEQALSSLRAGC